MSDESISVFSIAILEMSMTQLFLSNGLLYAGAGSGETLDSSAEIDKFRHVLLVEANPQYKKKLANIAKGKPGSSAASALLGDQEVATKLFIASNPAESSTILPSDLTGFWLNPNRFSSASVS